MKAHDDGIRQLVRKHFEASHAHLDFEAAVKGFTPELAGRRVEGLAHTAWQLVWHIWFSQKDLLDYHVNPGYASIPWPQGYWPKEDGPADAAEWRRVLEGYRSDVKRITAMLGNPEEDLLAPKATPKTSLLRVALLAIDHTAYHVGQLVDLKRLLRMKV